MVEMTEQQRQLFIDLCCRGSLQSLRFSVRDKELAPFQTTCVAIGMIMEKLMISLDTGLGKTLVATALINIWRKKYPGIKWIYLCQHNNLKTTCDKINSGLYNATAIWTGADQTSVLRTFFKRDALSADVLVLPYNILENKAVNDFIFRNRTVYRGVCVDESQTVGNDDSYTFRMVSGLLNNARFAYMLTATPIRVDPEQICNQLAIMDRRRYGFMGGPAFISKYKVMLNGTLQGYQNLGDLEELIMFGCVSYTRDELCMKGNYKVKVLWRDPKPEYLKVSKMDAFSEILGDPDGPAIDELVNMCVNQASQGHRGLVYINRTVNKVLAKERLEAVGLRVDIMDGKFTGSQKKKDKVHQAYLNDELDVLITNISTGKDLPSDYICFYELTFDFKQMLGRGERGLKGKDMRIYFILIRNTQLIEYFYKNVYERGVFLEEILGKDIEELREAYAQVSAVAGDSENYFMDDDLARALAKGNDS